MPKARRRYVPRRGARCETAPDIDSINASIPVYGYECHDPPVRQPLRLFTSGRKKRITGSSAGLARKRSLGTLAVLIGKLNTVIEQLTGKNICFWINVACQADVLLPLPSPLGNDGTPGTSLCAVYPSPFPRFLLPLPYQIPLPPDA